MKQHLALAMIVSSVLLCSCSRSNDTSRLVYDIENYIESRPDSALAVLQSLDTRQLHSDKDRAKYALYLSMALDKNYIDKTDFDVLQPAIDYFSKHGSATDKLRTFYYQGIIYFYRNEFESALSSFVVSLEEGENSNDELTKARNLYIQSYIYSTLYDWNKYISTSREASVYYKKNNRYDEYLDCLIRIMRGYDIINNHEKAIEYMKLCEENLQYVSNSTKNHFFSMYLLTLSDDLPISKTEDILSKYLDNTTENNVNWISIANAYFRMNNYTKALEYMSLVSQPDTPEGRVQYYALLSMIYENLDYSKKSLEAYKKYISISDSLDIVIFKNDTKFVEERHELEIAALKEKQRKNLLVSIAALLLIILSATAALIYSRLKISKMEYRQLYAQMEDERDNLSNLLNKSHGLNKEITSAVANRINLLNKFFTAYISDNYDIDRKASKEMESLLANKDEFMNSTRLAFAGTHPKFIQYLEEKGLTEWEINYCCLYALGLKGKEVGAYMKMRSHYNNSSIIREKLGIGEHDTNLGIYIRRLLQNPS